MRVIATGLVAAGLVVAAATGAPAQTSPGRAAQMEQARASVETNLKTLREALALTPAQQPYWPPIESAIRISAQERAVARQQMRGQRTGEKDFLFDLERRSVMAAERAEAARKLAAALRPLWGLLDQRQKDVVKQHLTKDDEGRRRDRE
jgi:hypothetical protein